MRLIHNPEDNLSLALVCGSKLTPDIRELRVGRPTLTNNLIVPPSVVVYINDTRRSSRKTSLNQGVVLAKIRCV